jgi:hypothetical protein
MFSWNGSGGRGWFGRRSIAATLALGAIMLLYGAISIGPAISAAEGHGTKGYFVAQSLNCGRHGCNWSGEFRLPDGQVTRTGVGFTGGDTGMHVGTVVPALDTGGLFDVFPRHGDTSWLLSLALLVGGAGLLGYRIVTWARRRRGGTPGMTDPGGDSLPQLV